VQPLLTILRRTRLLALLAAGLASPALADVVNEGAAVALPREIMGDEADARRYQVCTALVANDPDAAFDQALAWRYEGGGPPAWHCAGLALVALGFHAEAGEVFERMAREMPAGYQTLQAEVLGQAGQAWLAGGVPGRALAMLDAALGLDDRNPELLIDRAQALAAQGGYWEAIDDLDRAIELSRQSGEAYGFRAAAYRYVGSLELAADDIARALVLRPDDPVLLLERGNIRRLRGNDAGARSDWLRILTEAPGTPAAQSAQTNLERLDVNIE
jgi:tetratricopeptide (TPR) repeat protein